MGVILRFFLLGAFFSFLVSCLIEGGGMAGVPLYEVDECYFTKDLRTGKAIKWDMDIFPISFYIHESTPDAAYFNFVSAVDFWNIRWAEYMEKQGGEAGPLLEVVGKGNKYSLSDSPIRDDYNMLIFAQNSDIQKIIGSKNLKSPISKIQAVTYSQQYRFKKGSLRSADILVNKTNFKYYYDENYDQNILALKSDRSSYRAIAFTKVPSFWASIKARVLRFFLYFFEFFKEQKQRDIAGIKKSIPGNLVDFPSLMVHELGHALALAHVDENQYQGGRSRLEASKQSDLGDITEQEKKKSVMKVELPRGSLRRDISDFDLENMFCGYYEN